MYSFSFYRETNPKTSNCHPLNSIKETKSRYQDRFVILDATPSQLTAETNAIANHVDGVILVIMNGKTPRAAVLQTVENIGRQKILGIVFNGSAQSYKAYDRYYSRYYK